MIHILIYLSLGFHYFLSSLTSLSILSDLDLSISRLTSYHFILIHFHRRIFAKNFDLLYRMDLA